MLRKMSPEEREKFLEQEREAKVHDQDKSKHLMRTTRAYNASSRDRGRGRGRGRGGQGRGSYSPWDGSLPEELKDEYDDL